MTTQVKSPEMPEEIWAHDGYCWTYLEGIADRVKYIRADLVKERTDGK